MSEGADQVGLILLITGAGGAFGKILQATGIADYIAGTLSGFSIPILVLCFVICQIIRCSPYNNSSHYGWYNCYIRSISDSVCDCYLCRWYWSFHAKRFRILGNQPFLRNLRTGYNQRMEYRWFRSRCCNSDFCINPFSLPGILTRIDVS